MSLPRTQPFEHDRLHELLADRALQGLEPGDHAELEGLLMDDPMLDPGGYEQAAAVAMLAMLGRPAERLPDVIRKRIGVVGAEWAARDERPRPLRLSVDAESSATSAPLRAVPRSRRPASAGRVAGWLAAAACLVLAVLGWWPRLAPSPSPEAAMNRLLARAPADLVQWSWTDPAAPAGGGVRGEVIWSDSLQRGFMRFTGLPANDPARAQYQLWIFDQGRKSEYPVDGGVFDIRAAGSEVVIPIDPKLNVAHATMFAVTVEQPGGVARSDRERIAAIAQPPA